MAVIDLAFAIKHLPDVLKGVPATLAITIIAMICGLFSGLLISFVRIFKLPVLNQGAVLFISFIRGTPLIVQLYMFYYGLPVLFDYLNGRFGLQFNADNIHPLYIAFIAYTINTSAYQAEIMRGAIQSVDRGQMEAALSIGMTVPQALRRIIMPQAFRTALPDLGNTFIHLIKATSLAFAVKVMEILAISRTIANDGYRFLEMYLVAALLYWLLSWIFEIVFTKLEQKVSRYEKAQQSPVKRFYSVRQLKT